MNIVIKVLKGIGFGLFKIHLWLPAVYSLIFLIVTLAGGYTGVAAWYFAGLVVSLLGSVGLTYYGFQRKIKKGDYRSGEKKSPVPPGKRKLLIEREEPSDGIIPRRAPEQPARSYAPALPVYDQPIPQPNVQQMQAYEASRALYGNNYGQAAPRTGAAEQLGYDPRAALYESGYGAGNGRNYEQGYDPRAELYGGGAATAPDRQSADAARQSLYESEPARANMSAYVNRSEASQTLYPSQGAAREALERGDASQALYPSKEQSNFNSYDRSSASGALYHESQQSDYKTFSPYMQPVNSILPNRGQPQSLYGAPEANPPPAGQEPAYNKEADVRRRDAEFMASANLAPAPPSGSRRREVPVQIYATKNDENTYVYEYADRFEFIKLLEDGNKELVKTEFKS